MFEFPYNLRKMAQLSHSADISELMEEYLDRHPQNGSAANDRSAKPNEAASQNGHNSVG